MELREEYKQTEIGLIPVDWDLKKFGEISWVNQGLQIAISNRLKRPTQNSKIYITIEYLNQGKDVEFIDTYSNSVVCNVNDVLMTRTGNTGIVVTGYEGVFHNNFFKINFDHKILDKNYLVYYLSLPKTKKIILEKAGTSTIPDLNHKDFYSIPIALPANKEEQAKIAQVLSDKDELISSLEKLIEKKKLIKQGAMQQLLTGKKRLSGFSGKWKIKKLCEIGEITGAGIDKKIRPNEIPVRLVNYLDVYHKNFIYSKHLNHWVTAPEHQAQRCRVKKGDIFFTPSSETPDDIGISALAVEDIDDAGYSYHVVRLRLLENWDFNFRAYIFKTRFFLNQAEKFCEGSGKRYVISLKRFRELEIFYPTDKKEQESISAILRDIDLEIETLEQKLNKYKSIKQGMMQVLLTGKIRLVKPQAMEN